MMMSEIDVKYDKKVVNNLISSVARYPVGTTVKTNEQARAVVISQKKDPENPIIMLLSAENENIDINLENNLNKMNLMLEKNISILQVVW